MTLSTLTFEGHELRSPTGSLRVRGSCNSLSVAFITSELNMIKVKVDG